MLRKKKAKNAFCKGNFKLPVNKTINELCESRKIRNAMVFGGGSIVPTAITSISAIHSAIKPLFSRPLSIKENAIAFGISAATTAVIGQCLMAKDIRKATYKVGAVLGEEAKKNTLLREFLQKNKYVVIDRKGQIVAVKSKRKLGIFGRIRLESSKIINGEYGKYNEDIK